ncbi:MAG TPA: metallophosphoesterase [Myxococcota bacterium]|nr:metallophosphoesterase [Myxococcota bacterium]
MDCHGRYSNGSLGAIHAPRDGAVIIDLTLAHLSDLHVTPIRVRRLGELANKRALGWLSWRRRRRHEHRAEILDALLDDLATAAPDHVAITGDLTNVGLPEEIEAAVAWLERMGGPGRVSLVPGNHDAYAAAVERERFAAWLPYLQAPDGAGAAARAAEGELRFPWVKRVGGLALVGLSSAVPTLPGLASGALGAAQLARLDETLAALARERVGRVILVHHPPVPAGQSRRRQLSDAAALRAVLARHGADLVIHGHTHRTSLEHVAGPDGPIPVVGVPSSSARGSKPGRRASYHLYRFATGESGAGLRITCAVRALEPDRLRFSPAGEHAL